MSLPLLFTPGENQSDSTSMAPAFAQSRNQVRTTIRIDFSCHLICQNYLKKEWINDLKKLPVHFFFQIFCCCKYVLRSRTTYAEKNYIGLWICCLLKIVVHSKKQHESMIIPWYILMPTTEQKIQKEIENYDECPNE